MRRLKLLSMLATLAFLAMPCTAAVAKGKGSTAVADKPPSLGVEQASDKAADKVFDEAMRSQDPFLLTASGQRYEAGVGVPQDADKAVKLYCRAAGLGAVDAQYRLGYLYAHGRGVKRDLELGGAWFSQAAKAGHAMARTQIKLLKVNVDAKRQPSCLPAAPGGTPEVETRIALRPHPASGEIAKLVHSLAPKYKLDPSLVLAVVEVESNFDPQARSPKDAQGLMQLIPATAERFGVVDIWDPEQNLKGGMAYLRWLLDHFEGDLKLALAGYNAGEGAVEKHGGVPPFEETQAYVARILRRLGIEEIEAKQAQETS